MIITVAGKIGAGKSSLSELLGNFLEVPTYYEPVNDNGLLELYYSDNKKYGYLFQTYILTKRYELMKKALRDNNSIMDRSILEDSIFVEHLKADNKLSQYEYDTYHSLLKEMMESFELYPKRRPDVLIYVDIPFEDEIKRINGRARDFERCDEGSELYNYFQEHSKHYDSWFENYSETPVIRIKASHYDYVNNRRDRELVLMKVLIGLHQYSVITDEEFSEYLDMVAAGAF